MSLKSNIDWNEIIPLLPRAKREELYLEAVTLLSQDDREKELPHKKKKRANRYDRYWEDSGDGKVLSSPGRKFRINKRAKMVFRSTNIYSDMWQLLKESHNDIITYEGIASIWEGIRAKYKSMQPLSTVIGTLWARKAIDVYTEK